MNNTHEYDIRILNTIRSGSGQVFKHGMELTVLTNSDLLVADKDTPIIVCLVADYPQGEVFYRSDFAVLREVPHRT